MILRKGFLASAHKEKLTCPYSEGNTNRKKLDLLIRLWYSLSTDRSVGFLGTPTMMTKEEILDAAAQIFRIKGYHATSMSDIASAVNLQKASLYHHVSSKQEILLELLDQGLELLTGQIIGIARDETLLPCEKLHHMIAAYLKALTDHFDLTTVLLIEHRSLKPEFHIRHIPNRDRFEAIWREVVEEGMQTDVFRGVDTALAVRNLLGAMNWTITWYSPTGNLPVNEIAEQTASLFLNGLRGK